MSSTPGSSTPRLQLPRTRQERHRPESIRRKDRLPAAEGQRGSEQAPGWGDRHGHGHYKGNKRNVCPSSHRHRDTSCSSEGSGPRSRGRAKPPERDAPRERSQALTPMSLFRAGSLSPSHKIIRTVPGLHLRLPAPPAAVQTEEHHAPRHQSRPRASRPAQMPR